MNMVKVINGEVTPATLPKSDKLHDGRTVSNYHLLPADVLLQEGWYPLEQQIPEYDAESQYIEHDRYDIQTDKVIEVYRVVPIGTE
jgi:hypothetical protein